MQRFLKILCAGLVALTSLIVVADEKPQPKRFYVRAGVGFPTYRKVGTEGISAKFKPIGNIAAGWNFSKYISCEVEGGYASFPIRRVAFRDREYKSRSTSVTALLNIIVHKSYLLGENVFNPFIGVGAGYVNNTLSDLVGVEDDVSLARAQVNQFGYQFFLGTEWLVHPNLSLVCDARWIDFSKLKWVALNSGHSKELHLRAQTFTMGVKFNF